MISPTIAIATLVSKIDGILNKIILEIIVLIIETFGEQIHMSTLITITHHTSNIFIPKLIAIIKFVIIELLIDQKKSAVTYVNSTEYDIIRLQLYFIILDTKLVLFVA